MFRKIVLIFTGLIIFSFLFATEVTETYFKFSITSRQELDKLTKIISIDNVKNLEVFAYANEKELAEFQKLGYSYIILPHPGTLYIPRMAFSREEMRNWDYYPTYETYVDIMYQFAADHPSLCIVENIGYSVQEREILFAKISDNVNIEENEPEFFYTSTMHGDETTGYVLMLHLIDYLLSNYGIDPQVTNLIDEVEIWINPLANPDGTYHGGNNSVWGAIRYNVNGVDLNRNFPDPEDGPHPDGNEWQPETIAMMDFADEHNFVLSANFHGGEEVVNYPWDTWPRLHADDAWYQDISHTYADAAHANSPPGYMSGFNNGITNGYAWYTINGGRQDYMNYFQNAREVTIELSEVKLLPEAQLLDHWNYNKDSFLLYMEECLYGIRGLVTNNSGIPIDAMITVLNHDFDNSEIVTDPDIGNYHRMLYTGSYDLMFYSYGYLTQTIENINVTGGDITFVDVVLESAQEVTINGIVTNGSNGSPIENATVEILDTPLEPVTTNSQGEYEIQNVCEGTYYVYISAEGYANIIEEITVSEENTVFDFVLYESEIESFETGDFSCFNWEFGGNAVWGIDSSVAFDGVYSAKSGSISHNQNTQLFITMETTYNGFISFYYKISSEVGYDYLKFYIDNELQEQWSGFQDWDEVGYFVTSGLHTFKWIYFKDNSVSSGNDCAWIDYISFPPSDIVNAENTQLLYSSKLIGNYPNPFNPETTINFSVAQTSSFVTIAIHNIKGQKVRTLINKEIDSGYHKVGWDGKDDNNRNVSSGIYFSIFDVKSDNEDFTSVNKMLLLK